MSNDLDKLEQLAKAATRANDPGDDQLTVAAQMTASAAFIAACDPATVLKLVQRLRGAERELASALDELGRG